MNEIKLVASTPPRSKDNKARPKGPGAMRNPKDLCEEKDSGSRVNCLIKFVGREYLWVCHELWLLIGL